MAVALLRWLGVAALAALLAGMVFALGARHGAQAALAAVSAKVAQAQAARARPPVVGALPANPDPSTIASPATPTPAPKPGTFRRYVGDALVSEAPVSSLTQTATVEAPE